MPLYEYRRGGDVVERVRTVPSGYEDTRLGLLVDHRTGADGWRKADEPTPTPARTVRRRRSQRGVTGDGAD
ncbi:hypothetical protein GCM10009799_20560 [Nocardiopsis rhodophaea]|uniref:FmdB family transcriptional regulator n=1 Tax=Nocardiopsis rhodophaea TaxID=280238 RepID=A0ABN2SY33_9ACTN